jgi:hypothetical protein
MAKLHEMFWGSSGKSKSTAIAALVRHMHRLTGKRSRLYIGDGGLDTYRPEIEDGILEVCEFSHREQPSTIIDLMGDLWFPADPADPKSKWQPPPSDNPDLAKTHAIVVYEGASVMGKYLMGHVKGGTAWLEGQGRKVGQGKDELFKVQDAAVPGAGDARAYGGNSVGHYNYAQPLLLSAIQKSRKFGGAMVIWTAHPKEAPDLDEGAKTEGFGQIVGKKLVVPEIAGKALSAQIFKEFTNTLHFDTATKLAKLKDPQTGRDINIADVEFRIYTRSHFDPDGNTGTEYRAVSRAQIPAMMPLYIAEESDEAVLAKLKPYPGIDGAFWNGPAVYVRPDASGRPGNGILTFYQILAEIQKTLKGAK